MITVVPATLTQEPEVYSRVLALDIEGQMRTAVFSMYPDDSNQNNGFNGHYVSYTLGGEPINAFRVQQDTIVARIVLPRDTINIATEISQRTDGSCNCDDGALPDCCFEEHILDAVIIIAHTGGIPPDELYNPRNEDIDFDANAPVTFLAGGSGTLPEDPDERDCLPGYVKNDNGVCVLAEEDKIKNELDNPCAKDVFTELEDGIYVDDILSPEMQVPVSNLDDVLSLNFSESILNLFNGSNTFDFIIQNGTPLNSNANASTNTDLISINPNRWSVTTTINNTYLTNATRLSIARTIIHELVHGYLLARSNELDFTIAIAMYATENGIDISDTNAFHHEFMRQYINGMAYSLYEWDKDYGTGGNLGWDYYYAMAFSGQFQVDTSGTIASTTDTFLELVPNTTDRQNIVNIILNEQNNSNNAQGTDCD